jgi:hypothetical protein
MDELTNILLQKMEATTLVVDVVVSMHIKDVHVPYILEGTARQLPTSCTFPLSSFFLPKHTNSLCCFIIILSYMRIIMMRHGVPPVVGGK